MAVYKIGIDYHGVITANPVFFAGFCHSALAQNCLIYIISGGSEKDIRSFLNEYHINYSYIFSLVDYFDKQGLVTRFADGSFKVEDDLWNTAKARFCAREKVDFHIDDSAIYGSYFKTPFCLYEVRRGKCLMPDRVIDFARPATDVLTDILRLIRQNKS